MSEPAQTAKSNVKPFAPQPCDCPETVHTGPHWLHMDYFDWRMNLRLLENAVNSAERGDANGVMFQMFAYSTAEAIRLKEKARCMESDRITHITYAELGNAYTEDVQARARALYEQLRKAIEENRPSAPVTRMSNPRPTNLELWSA